MLLVRMPVEIQVLYSMVFVLQLLQLLHTLFQQVSLGIQELIRIASFDNGDGTWTFTFDPAPTDEMEYFTCCKMVYRKIYYSCRFYSSDWSCTPTDHTITGHIANRNGQLDSGDVTNVYGTCGTE